MNVNWIPCCKKALPLLDEISLGEDYPSSIVITKARAVKYYNEKDKKLPPSISLRYPDRDQYGWLLDSDGNKVIKNKKSAGTPRKWVVNLQDLYSGKMGHFQRSNYVKKLKEVLNPFVSKIKPLRDYCIYVAIELHDTTCSVDIDNKGALYNKCILDLLTANGIIIDDSIDFVKGVSTIFIQSKQKDLKIKIYGYKRQN